MNRKILLSYLTLTCFVTNAEDKPINLEQLVKSAPRRANGIEDLIERLPKNLRSDFILMSKSQSLQDADAKHPRVILSSPEGINLFAFNGHPNQKNYQSLEVIQFNRDLKKFELREITYVPESRSFTISEVNPQRCLSCHGEDPRPNWEPYEEWPGAIGDAWGNAKGAYGIFSVEDRIIEQRQFEDFKRSHKTNPRYKNLKLTNGHISELHHTQVSFTGKVAALNFLRLSRIIQSEPAYREYKWVVLGALLCQDFPGLPPDPTNNRFSNFFPTELRKWHQDRTKRVERGSLAANLNLIFEPLGHDTSRWSMNFISDGADAANQDRYGTPGNSRRELAAALISTDPDLQRFWGASTSNVYAPNSYRADDYGSDESNRRCNELKAKSLEALSQRATNIVVETRRELNLCNESKFTDEESSIIRATIRSCLDCHGTASSIDLSLENPIKFPEFLNRRPTAKHSTKANVYLEILARIDSQDSDYKMPPTHQLNEEPKKLFKRYLGLCADLQNSDEPGEFQKGGH